MSTEIPAKAHFIWFGTGLHWVHALSMISAARRGGFDEVILHHADDLTPAPAWPTLAAAQARGELTLRPLDPEAILGAAGPHGPALVKLFEKLTQPAARANMVRAALLYSEGGVYLDTDTITVADLTPLRRQSTAFCGVERVVFPEHVKRSKNPLVQARAYAQTTMRDLMRRAPEGWRAFRRIEEAYPVAANNAVLASTPEHPFVSGLLQAMIDLPEARQTVRFALGTHLLQQQLKAYSGADMVVHPPEVFYPLGPEISEHWFRTVLPKASWPVIGRAPAPDEVMTERTRVVHWYASVRTKKIVPQINPDYVRRHADHQLFSALAASFL
ncbi:MAG: glycosyltransferase [Bradymonadia bacterium]